MQIALVTCRDLPDWEVDDRPLWAALRRRGATVHHPTWDAAVDWPAFDAVILRTTWDYWNRGEEFRAWIDHVASHPRLFNPAPVLRWSLDKRYLADLHAAGVPTIETVWLAPGERPDLGALLAARGWPRAFLKPAFGASAHATLRFDTDAAGLRAAEAHLRAHGQDVAFLLQPYLGAVETFGEVSAILIGGIYAHGVRKVPVPGDYRVQDDYGAHDEPYDFSPAERALCEQALRAATAHLGLREPLLYARVDWLRDASGALRLTELELVEPSLFFRHGAASAERLAELIVARAGPPTARVIGQQGERFRLRGGGFDGYGVASGTLRAIVAETGEHVVVGDRVALGDAFDAGYDLPAVRIDAIAPRHGVLARGAAGGRGAQVLAANVDVACVVVAADAARNRSRVHRYVVAARACGAEPMVVLSKVDLVGDADALAAALGEDLPGVRVCAVSTQPADGDLAAGVAPLRRALRPGETFVLLGPSGGG